MVLLGGNDEARGRRKFVFCYNRVEILIFEQGSIGKGCINDIYIYIEREISRLIKGLITTMILKGQQKTCTHVQGKLLLRAEDR